MICEKCQDELSWLEQYIYESALEDSNENEDIPCICLTCAVINSTIN